MKRRVPDDVVFWLIPVVMIILGVLMYSGILRAGGGDSEGTTHESAIDPPISSEETAEKFPTHEDAVMAANSYCQGWSPYEVVRAPTTY